MPRWFSANVRIGLGKRRLCLIPHCGAVCTEWTFRNCWREPKNGDSSEGADFRGGSRCENQGQLRRIASGLRNNYFGTPELQASQQKNAPAGRSNRPSSKAAASEDPEAYPLGYVEDLSDARTLLVACFSTLLEKIADQLHRLFRRGSSMTRCGARSSTNSSRSSHRLW